jgi:DNA repair exonuclease SbcCD ATPase subunit
LQFTNTTGLHLMQGPITVFEGGSYAGDAKIEDLPPDAQRLISYAVDLDTEVAPQTKGRPEELLGVRLIKGALIATRKYVREQEYTVKNSGKAEKKVLIEYPFDASWKLVKPEKPAEKTRDLYRFAVDAKPGEPALLKIEEERTDSQNIAMNNLDDGSIQFYLSAKAVSDKVKEALKEIVKRKTELGQLTAKKQQLEQRIRDIGEDQTRIRQNMAQLDRNSDVYKNYVKKFSDQESEIEKLRAQIATLADEETGMRKALDEYMLALDLQ